MFFLYSLIFTLGALFASPYAWWRTRRLPSRQIWWRERWGQLPAEFCQLHSGSIWVHAVSVGETLAVARLVRALQQKLPERRIFLSHVTPTGREAGEKRLPPIAGRFYLPFDWARCVRRALVCLKPGLLLIAETELWPNLLLQTHRSGARIVLVNARLSDRSFRGYRVFRFFMRRVLENIDGIFVQTPRDRDRFCAIGANPEHVVVAGNVKFDARPPATAGFPDSLQKALTAAGKHPVAAAASTMPGEEEEVLKAWSAVRHAYPRGMLILVPRHPERFDQVARLLEVREVPFVRRSSLTADAAAIAPELATPSVLLLDSIGELGAVFSAVDVAFMGGSLVPTGGHNLIEPALWGKPVIFGPHMESFRDVASAFLEAGAAIRCANAEQLSASLLRLFADEEQRKAMGEAGRSLMEKNSGATDRVIERLVSLLQA
jgi:3-deoxy-D-manno-octulosonic-acid transferase